MKNRGLLIWVAVICVGCGVTMWLSGATTAVHAQQPAAQTQVPPEPSSQQPTATNEQAASQATVFKAQTKLVLVDSIVTDKKGNYIRNLTQKNFRVWEDNKEQ